MITRRAKASTKAKATATATATAKTKTNAGGPSATPQDDKRESKGFECD
jgi:hypothetical protein